MQSAISEPEQLARDREQFLRTVEQDATRRDRPRRVATRAAVI